MSALLSYRTEQSDLFVIASGDWTLQSISKPVQKELFSVQQKILSLVTSGQTKKIFLEYRENGHGKNAWGSLLLSFFCSVCEEGKKLNKEVDFSSLPEQMGKLLDVDYISPLSNIEESGNLFYWLGDVIQNKSEQVLASMNFVGEITASFFKFLIGKAAISAKDVWQEMYNAGAGSVPIISLVSVLLGLILAFVSAIQLQIIGAEVYVSSLITVSMVRVMAPVLTGIVIAGRIGASYAATIGSMQVNEEVDALKTFGISPVDFLVLPRVLALSLMMPFLTVYADFMGILGGYLVIFFGWDVTFYAFLENVQAFTTVTHIMIGLFHAFVFGIIIALSGCYQGIVSGRDAEAVGRATTLAVVHSIIGIIVATSVLTIILSGFNL